MKIEIEKIRSDVLRAMTDSLGSHDWDHTERVCHLCNHIGHVEGADMEILETAAILHDIGRMEQHRSQNKICHAEVGAVMARAILERYQVSQEKIARIVHCIETHRFRGNKIPLSLEAKILFDADKLDSIGAIGLARAYVFSGEIGAKVHDRNVNIDKTDTYSKDDTGYREFLVKLRYVKDRMITDEGKRMAIKRHQFMVDFFDVINREVLGEQ